MTIAFRLITPTGRCVLRWIVLAAIFSPMPAWAQASVRVAEILEASGAVEIRRAPDAPWTTARSGQELLGSDALRTRTRAFARVKFEAGLLWLLSAESVLQLGVAVSGGATPDTIRVRLDRGRAVATWTPDRTPVRAEARAATPAPRAVVETPSGQASILGTEWSLSVDGDGRTALVVLEGTVELSNALDRVTVRANQAAEMRVGQAPTMLRVINPGDRVQWVADYSAQPRRFADTSMGSARAIVELSAADAAEGRTSAAIDRLEGVAAPDAPAGVWLALVDLLIEAGDLERARVHADSGRRRHPADGRFDAMLSRIALFDDRTAESRTLANDATVKTPASVEGWLALGEAARTDGDGPIARRAFLRATMVDPADARGWFGLGSVETDYEAFVPARRWLGRALELDPTGPGYRGELGTVETLANRLEAARREFTQARVDRPGDYIAMTGEALLALKQGREPEALDLLLRATLIEPSYARAHVYLGVTYYRLRRYQDAVRALNKSSTLDPKDPLPHLMVSAIHTDLYEPAKAIVAARTARDLMPNLKSLNQLANTQKGTANLGNSMAFFGMEQWAQNLAQESYSPFWAGSHLFLGDRYDSAFAKTSEYYQGLLADATVFGGSPTFQTLLPRAGHHATGTLSGTGNTANVYGGESALSLNGYLNRRMPIGYAFNFRGGASSGVRQVLETDASVEAHLPLSASAAVGFAPSPRWNAFITAARTRQDDAFILVFAGVGGSPAASVPVDWLQQGHRFDAGGSFRHSPDGSLTMRIGFGKASANLPSGAFLQQFFFEAAPADFQARYTTLRANRHELSAGVEFARNPQQLTVSSTLGLFPPVLHNDLSSRQVFVSGRSTVGHAVLHADVFVAREDVGAIRIAGDAANELPPLTKVQPRLGASIRMGTAVLRAAFQQRTRPWAALSTVGPVATAGIPLDDTLVLPGGHQRRGRVQLDWEWSSRMFTTFYADAQRVDNTLAIHGLEPLPGLVQGLFEQVPSTFEAGYAKTLSDLRDIARDASRLNVATRSDLEGPLNAAEGRIRTLGVAVNRMLARQVSVASRYRYARTLGITRFFIVPDEATRGHALSFMPGHVLALGATWISPRRIYASGEAIYKSHRFETAYQSLTPPAMRREREADWTARLAGSWESADKRWAIEFAGTDLLSEYSASTYVITGKFRR